MKDRFSSISFLFILAAIACAAGCNSKKSAGSMASGTAGSGADAGALADNDMISGNESASEVALSAVSDVIADDEGLSVDLALNRALASHNAFAQLREWGVGTAWAAPVACPVLSNPTLAGCSGGKLTLAFDSCQYQRLNQSFAKAVWTGSKILDFGATCPTRLSDITMIGRTVGDDTTRTGGDGMVLRIDTANPSGYDSSIAPQPSGGTSSSRSAASRSLEIKGIHYVAEKSATDATKLWDHTISTETPISIAVATGKRTVSGTVVLQHNLARYTARAEFSSVEFDLAQCGCLPVSGTITATLTGSRTGTETLTISGCGKASLADPDKAKADVTLRHCL